MRIFDESAGAVEHFAKSQGSVCCTLHFAREYTASGKTVRQFQVEWVWITGLERERERERASERERERASERERKKEM